MKVSNKAIEKYIQVCWISASKCETYEDVRYKIVRAVDLGTVIHRFQNGIEVIRYHNVNLTIKNDVVIDIDIDKRNPQFAISEKMKNEHYNKTYKVCV